MLPNSPARSLVFLHDEGGADEEAMDVLGGWPYRVLLADNTGKTTTLEQVAAEAGVSVLEAARNQLALEEANLLLWQPVEGAYWMLAPDPKAT